MLTISGDPLFAEPVLEEELIARPLTPMERYGIGWEEVAIHFAVTHDLLTEETASIEDEADIVVGLEAIRDHLREDGPEVGYGLLRDQLFSAAAHGLDFVGPVPVGTEEEMAIGIAEAAASGSTCGSAPNSTPIAIDDAYITAQEKQLVVPAPGVLSNDCEALNLPNTSHLYNGLTTEHGTLNLQVNGSFTYMPSIGYTGWDSFFYRAYGNGRWSNVALVEIVVIGADIDVDSDNNTDLESSTAEDNIEMNNPGKVLRYNRDDDNNNGTPDYLDGGNWATNDDDLQPVRISLKGIGQNDPLLSPYSLEVRNANPLSVKLWQTQKRAPLTTTVFQASTLATQSVTLYAEGINVSPEAVLLDLVLLRGGAEQHRDTVKTFVIDLELTAFRPQNQYFVPTLHPVPEATEHTTGAGIRRNGDDDNANGFSDNLAADAPVANENDLIQVNMSYSQLVTSVPGVNFVLRRGNDKLRVWSTATKTGNLIGTGSPIDRKTLTNQTTAWVEWVDTVGGPTADLILEAQMAANGNVIMSDTVKFYPFTSVVVAIVGETEEPGDPPPPGVGTSKIAVELYNEGYDVRMYDEPDGWDGMIEHALNALESAAERQGQSAFAFLGYSHGGGAIYELSERLILLNGSGQLSVYYTVPYSAYIDAVQQPLWNDDPELRRPLVSAFHHNQYQLNNWPHGGPGNSVDLETNRTSMGLIHVTIDDIVTVQNDIKSQLRPRVSK